MSSSNRLIVSILVVTALAIAFWMLALSPKREQATELSGQVEQLRASLAEAQSKATEAAAAKHEFPADYRQLVTLGQAVPASDETSSLLVELNQIATRSKVKFESMQLSASGEAATPATVTTPAPATSSPSPTGAVPAATTVPPTEVAASLLPLGATIGPAGLDVMPYELDFSGSFFQVADFIKRIDSLVHTSGPHVAAGGRLVTIDGFTLNADSELGFPHLDASFSVTTYLTPPSQGITAGATPTAPAPSTTTLTAETPATEAPATASSETVSTPR
jgi:Tfp pilus assembly protein PilO